MSDARDEIGRAGALQRRRAAAFQRRKEEAEAEIEQLRAERAGLARLEATPEVAALSAALGEKIEALTVEAAAAESEVRAALGEVTQLGQLARSLPVAEARNLAAQAHAIAGGGDLPGEAVVARALDGARHAGLVGSHAGSHAPRARDDAEDRHGGHERCRRGE